MGKFKNSQESEFSLEGRFLRYLVEDGYKIKRLELATADGEFSIKLTKEARAGLGQVLVPGDWVQVSGQKKIDPNTDLIKLKAYSVKLMVPNAAKTVVKPEVSTRKETILVCQKSDCMKRGGKAICQALETALSDRGLTDQVAIKGTGCMKNCSKGPNVVMPGKARYCKIDAKEISDLVDKHFPASDPVQPLKEVRELASVG
jgi:(2Fe-2S) ferredoxin